METRLQQQVLCRGFCSDTERLEHLWRLFVEKEDSVRTLTRELEELRVKHAAENDTVQLCLQDIRSLSKTRHSMALELERENETLRSSLTEINLEQEAQKSEIAEMLVQEGLSEVTTSSLSEQVAYLLADRAALMEKIQALEDDSKMLSAKCAQRQKLRLDETLERVAPLRGQSPWKRLLGFTKAAQAKQDDNQAKEDKTSKDRERSLLERDLDEASTRLNLAHKEIRRLTDELESAHLTRSTFESELHEVQGEAEQLRREVEKLKRHGELAELQVVKEMNEVMDAEIRHLRDSVHTMRAQLLELIDSNFKELDSEEEDRVLHTLTRKLTQTPQTRSLPKAKKKKQNDARTRCREELEEGLSNLQVVMKLQAELEQETALRKEVEEECDDQGKKEEAEQLSLEIQGEEHNAKVEHLQEKSDQDVLKAARQEQENLKLIQDIQKLEEVCEKLQTELQEVQCKLHSYIRKYDEMKTRHREKLARAKQVYLREMAWRDQDLEDRQRDLDILTKRLTKESNMVKMVMAENEALLLTKKTLLCQLHEAEQNGTNTAAKIYTLQLRVDFLEKDSVQQWEMNMEKSTRIAKLERQLRDAECLKSTQHLKHDGSRIVEGKKDARLSEGGPEASVIQKTKDGSVEKLGLCASPCQSGVSEMGYINVFTHNPG